MSLLRAPFTDRKVLGYGRVHVGRMAFVSVNWHVLAANILLATCVLQNAYMNLARAGEPIGTNFAKQCHSQAKGSGTEKSISGTEKDFCQS